MPENSHLSDKDVRENLGWLVDIPLFLDDERVEQLYDLTVRPVFKRYRKESIEEHERDLDSDVERVAGGVEAGIESGGVLSTIAGGHLKGWVEGEETTKDEDELTTQYNLIQTPQRQLAQIAIQYYHFDRRSSSETQGRDYHHVEIPSPDVPDHHGSAEDLPGWLKGPDSDEPRDLVVLDLPGKERLDEGETVPTKLVPTAAEFEDGTVSPLYLDFEGDYDKPPRYPEREKRWEDMGSWFTNINEDHPLNGLQVGERQEVMKRRIGDDIGEARSYYWKWFEDQFNPKDVTRLIEDAAEEHGDIRWIDFRLPLNETGFTLHLHIQAREKFNTGTFAYNLINRGYKHGLTLVGTVKSEPDMDVLAIYEH